MKRLYTLERAKCVRCGNVGVVYVDKLVYCASCYQKVKKRKKKTFLNP